MLKDFFINGCILIAFLFVGGQLFKNKPLRLDSPLKRRIILGVICGFLGILLMLFSIQVTPTFFMDLRNLAVVMAAIIGGIVPSIIAGAMIAIGRVALFPISETSIIVAIQFIIIGIGCGLTSHLKLPTIMRWIATVAFSSIVTSIVFIIVIPDSALLHSSLIYHWVTNIIFAVIVFYLLDYIRKSNELYRLYKENSKTDFLTGLNNVRQFDELFANHLDKAIRHNEHLSLLLIDIDHFKKVNDTYGHTYGDEVLKELASLLVNYSRSYDVVSRNGGEEFTVILPDCPIEKAYTIAERVRHGISGHRFVLSNGTVLTITVSIGVSSKSYESSDPEELYKLADKALYKAKETGRNKVC